MALQDRYETPITAKQLPNGRMVYRSMRPKTVNGNFLTDSNIIAEDMLRMDRLASNVYGDPLDWWILAAVNKRFHGSMFFKPGSTIVVPVE